MISELEKVEADLAWLNKRASIVGRFFTNSTTTLYIPKDLFYAIAETAKRRDELCAKVKS